ncbi:MAG: HAMP domain-containing histidine kinase, partial [Cyclobacteriaceae bacterium]|nr:HAMP domain-containing histidine kinase [Cyclobacteriaceae bacterium]
DSITRFLKPLAERIRGTKGQRAFSIQLNSQPLEKEAIERKYRSALRQADLPLLFEVECSPHKFDLAARPLRPEDEQLVITPAGLYHVSLSNLNNFALKRITPQIVFSIFLTALTSLSFFMLFRNIRAQQRLAELKNDFISNMTHELKTPVTTVGVALEALKNFNGLENPKLTQEYLAIAQNELSRLSLLTDKILKTSVFENNGIDVGQEAIDLEKVVEQTVQSLKLVFEKANAQVTIEKEGNDFTMKGGLVHITNVVYNLLDNALKYSPDQPRINIQLKDQPERIVIIVQDEGAGIPSEFKKKIFEKFFRVPTGDVHTVKGYGLGLSYVDAVVKAHGGTIEVDSLPGKGSSFTITWPRQKV